MRIYFFLSLTLLFILDSVEASWLCREAASQRIGNIINACGVSEASSENEARLNARKAAFEELDSICEKTPDCANFEYMIQPLRTDCEKTENGYKCYRGIEAEITSISRDPTISRDHAEKIIIPVKKIVIQEDLLANKIERSVVQFNSKPAGAQVYVDGVQVCESPCSRELQLGKHQINFKKINYESFETALEVAKKNSTLTANLKGIYGYLDLSEIPGEVTVKVDDLEIEYEKIKLLPGKHFVSIESKNYQPYTKEVEIKKGITSKLHNVLVPLWGFAVISAKDKKQNAVKAHIFIDGEKHNESTPAKIRIPSGTRSIEIATSDGLYGSTIKEIEADTVYNLNFILSNSGKARFSKWTSKQAPARMRKASIECYENEDCGSGFQCATIKGEYPGSCVKKGFGF